MMRNSRGFGLCLGAGMAALAVLSFPSAGNARGGSQASPGVMERLGGTIPPDVECVNEQGVPFRLRDLIDRPTLLSLVYYRCEHVCPQLLVGLSELVSDLGLVAGRDYRLVTVSFDDGDTPAAAAEAKRNYLLPLGAGFDGGAWTFAMASGPNIARLTSALGFRFVRKEHGFDHPVVLVVLAPGGMISRYFRPRKYNYGEAYPVRFSPLEIKESLEAAGQGRIQAGPPGPLLFCFAGEPPGEVGYFRITRLFGWITLGSLALLFVYLSAVRRRSREESPHAR